MFVVQALADFSSQTMSNCIQKDVERSQSNNHIEQTQAKQKICQVHQQQQKPKVRQRQSKHNTQLQKVGQKNQRYKQKQTEQQNSQKKQPSTQQTIKYAIFKQGQKILVKQTHQNGWWLGHVVGKPQSEGYFPSNYIKVLIKPPPPKKVQNSISKQQEVVQFNENEGQNWIKKQLENIEQGPVRSDYYQGIKGYKMVKIDEKNQNILKGNHVQFDVSTGLAKVPVKDQAPTAKAVRQMGYYFDYHQWNEGMNQNPSKKSRPDPRKKKPKKLNLKLMD